MSWYKKQPRGLLEFILFGIIITIAFVSALAVCAGLLMGLAWVIITTTLTLGAVVGAISTVVLTGSVIGGLLWGINKRL